MSKRSLAMAETEPDDLTTDERLAAIDRERAGLNAELASLPAREQILLENDAGDDAFASLDRVKRRAEIGLAKLDIRERAVLAQARQEHDAALAAAWREHRQLYQAAAADYVAAVREAQRLEAGLLELARAIQATNGGQRLPTPLRVIQDLPLTAFTESVAGMSPEPIADAAAEHFPVLLRDRYKMCNAGEVVSLTAAEGWALIDAGTARWAPGVKPPRRVGAGA